jgi:hypothetical protein
VGPYFLVGKSHKDKKKTKNNKKFGASKSILIRKKNGRAKIYGTEGSAQITIFIYVVGSEKKGVRTCSNRKDGQTDRQTVFCFHASFTGSVQREIERERETREFSYGGD